MEFGLFVAQVDFATVRETARLAEELGYHSAWVPEHHFGLFGCLPAPAVFLAHLAAHTKRVKLAPATVLLPCNHPLRVAEEFALLDLLSNGRAGIDCVSRFTFCIVGSTLMV